MLLANFDRKEHLQHRAVSLRQHGFLVLGYGCSEFDSFARSIVVSEEPIRDYNNADPIRSVAQDSRGGE